MKKILLPILFFLIIPQVSFAALNLKGVDIMQWSKDTLDNPKTVTEINNHVAALHRSFNIQYVGLSVPMNTNAESMTERGHNFGIQPYTYAQEFADAIHNNGMNVLWRPADSYLEGLYDFTRWTGSNRIATGTVASAPTDGYTTWLGRTYNYIIDHPTLFADGDIWGPHPEGTNGIFSDSTSFLPNTGPGLNMNYRLFYADLKTVSDNAFAVIGKNVLTGYSSQNWTEIHSGYLPASFFGSIVPVDFYGSDTDHTPAQFIADIEAIYESTGKPIFIQEWGDYWSTEPFYGFNRTPAQHKAYLDTMYAAFQHLIDEGVVVGFNYWRAVGGAEALMPSAGTSLLYTGDKYAAFLDWNTQQFSDPRINGGAIKIKSGGILHIR